MTADPQQARVYAAEAALEPLARRFTGVAEVVAFLQHVVADEAVGARWPRAEVPEVRIGPPNLSCSYATDDGLMVLRRDHLDAVSVLHEFAHTLEVGDGHGTRFATAFAFLVRRHVGVDAWASLAGRYEELVVSWTPLDYDGGRTRRPLSDGPGEAGTGPR
jgi:putative metallohydrolase (TIGR04338 family)